MKKLFCAVIIFFVIPVIALAEENYFYLDTPIEGIYTTMDKIERLASNTVKPVRNRSTNEYMYCVSPGFAINPSGNYQKISNNPWEYLNISKEKYEKIQLISYFGYMYQNHTDIKWYAITKYMVWQEVLPEGWSVYLTEVLRGEKTHKFDYMINEINNLINNYYKTPNIDQIITGNYKDTITIYDTNNVLNNYISDNPNVIIEGNTLIIKPNNNSFSFNLKYKTDNVKSDLYIYDDAQWLISRGSAPSKSINYNVEILKGDLKITKKIENLNDLSYKANLPLKGAKYKIFNDYYNEIFETDESGTINIKNLNIDNYYIKEILPPPGFELDDFIYQIHIDPNKNNEISVFDKVTVGQININKQYLDTDLTQYKAENNAYFGVYNDKKDLLVKKNTDDNGNIIFYLPIGNYIVTQLSGKENYNLVKSEEIEITDSNPIILSYINYPIPKPIPDNDQILETEENIENGETIEDIPLEEKINKTDDLNNINNHENDVICENPIKEEVTIKPIDLYDLKIETNTIPVINTEYNPQTSDNISKHLLIFLASIIMINIFNCVNFVKKRGNREKKRNIYY